MMTTEEKLNQIISLLLGQKEVLTVDDLCLLTGYSKSFWYKASANRTIPHSSPSGGRIFFDRKTIQEWLMSNPVPTANQIQNQAINYVTLKPNSL